MYAWKFNKTTQSLPPFETRGRGGITIKKCFVYKKKKNLMLLCVNRPSSKLRSFYHNIWKENFGKSYKLTEKNWKMERNVKEKEVQTSGRKSGIPRGQKLFSLAETPNGPTAPLPTVLPPKRFDAWNKEGSRQETIEQMRGGIAERNAISIVGKLMDCGSAMAEGACCAHKKTPCACQMENTQQPLGVRVIGKKEVKNEAQDISESELKRLTKKFDSVLPDNK